jgi:putative hydrolase of the HAD superfamily
MEAVLLDLGGVIYEIDWTTTNRLLSIDEKLEWWTWPEYDSYERGHLTTKEFQAAFEAKTSRRWEEADFTNAIQKMVIHPLEGVEDLLKRIKLPLFALSNTNQAHFDFFIHHSVMKLFKHIYTSFEFGFRKPQPEIYKKTLNAISLPASSILFVDDREENLIAAHQMGFMTAQTFNDTSKLENIFKKFEII